MEIAKLLIRTYLITLSLCLLNTQEVRANQEVKEALVVGKSGPNCPGATHTRIQAAVNSLKNGGEIKVCPGNYSEQIVITKPVKIIGQKGAIVSPSRVKGNTLDFAMDEGLAAAVLIKDTDGVLIKGLTIDGANVGSEGCEPAKVGVVFQDASGEIKNVKIQNFAHRSKTSQPCDRGYGVFIQSSDDGEAEVVVEGNTLHGFGEKSIVGANFGTIVRAKNNVMVDSNSAKNESFSGVNLDFGATGTIEGNKFAIGE